MNPQDTSQLPSEEPATTAPPDIEEAVEDAPAPISGDPSLFENAKAVSLSTLPADTVIKFLLHDNQPLALKTSADGTLVYTLLPDPNSARPSFLQGPMPIEMIGSCVNADGTKPEPADNVTFRQDFHFIMRPVFADGDEHKGGQLTIGPIRDITIEGEAGSKSIFADIAGPKIAAVAPDESVEATIELLAKQHQQHQLSDRERWEKHHRNLPTKHEGQE